jgi:hypothetical protein
MFSTSNMEGMLLGLTWVFGWAVFVLVVIFLRNRKRQKIMELIHKERLAAMEKGIPPPEWPDYSGKGLPGEGMNGGWIPSARSHLGTGGLLFMLGIGTCVAFLLLPESDVNQFWPVGLILVFLGLGYGLRYLLTKNGGK